MMNVEIKKWLAGGNPFLQQGALGLVPAGSRQSTMIASQGGDRRQGCERNKAGRDESFTDAMGEGHDR